MATNKIGCGDVLTLTAPSPGVVSGTPYKIGSIICIAAATAATGVQFAAETEGEWNVPADTGTAWAEGDLVYWDNTAKNFTKTSTSNTKAGVVSTGGKLSASTTAWVKLVPTI